MVSGGKDACGGNTPGKNIYISTGLSSPISYIVVMTMLIVTETFIQVQNRAT